MTRSKKGETAILYGANESNIFQVGRVAGGHVLVKAKYPLTRLDPATARELAQLLIKVANKVDAGDLPLAPGKDAG